MTEDEAHVMYVSCITSSHSQNKHRSLHSSHKHTHTSHRPFHSVFLYLSLTHTHTHTHQHTHQHTHTQSLYFRGKECWVCRRQNGLLIGLMVSVWTSLPGDVGGIGRSAIWRLKVKLQTISRKLQGRTSRACGKWQQLAFITDS